MGGLWLAEDEAVRSGKVPPGKPVFANESHHQHARHHLQRPVAVRDAHNAAEDAATLPELPEQRDGWESGDVHDALLAHRHAVDEVHHDLAHAFLTRRGEREELTLGFEGKDEVKFARVLVNLRSRHVRIECALNAPRKIYLQSVCFRRI